MKRKRYQVRYWTNGGGFIYSPAFSRFRAAEAYARALPKPYDWVIEEDGMDKWFNPAFVLPRF